MFYCHLLELKLSNTIHKNNLFITYFLQGNKNEMKENKNKIKIK